MLRFLGRTILFILAATGSLVILLLIGAFFAFGDRTPRLPERMILALDLDRGVTEQPDPSPLALLRADPPLTMPDLLMALERAAEDDRVTGVFATLSSGGFGLAEAQELRDAVLRFRQSGKPAVLFSESIGEFGSATVEYYLASAFSEIWLQPSGTVSTTGFLAEAPFLRGTLEKLEIRPAFSTRHEYKSAPETFTRGELSTEARENLTALVDSLFEQTVDGIAASRDMEPQAVRALIDRSPLLAEEALQAGLVDKLGYRDQAESSMGGHVQPRIRLSRYLRALPEVDDRAGKIAVIIASGAIMPGDSDENPLSGASNVGANTIRNAFREAVNDSSVRAIVFRIDSPGGSYTASDAIWREVQRARELGKPVIVSMGRAAASGGYFVAMPADRIIAQPGTITGSIGVFAGKMVLADFWDKIGVSWDGVARGQNAAMWSPNRDFSPEAQQRFETMLDAVYADFTGKAREARNLTDEQIDRAARGRIFSGAQALELGLVDELGGYPAALAAARRAAGIAEDAPLGLKILPSPQDPMDLLFELIGGNGGLRILAQDPAIAHLLAPLRPLAALLEQGAAQPGDLRMPPMEIR
ncbi:signal peptide peptidase SppA [Telmatospirillum sp. J64-1]|uniref:signal peptide peptidase SppA n=1 Tax=Telmatospirillum sp. J64-1 TaxID=2502183 RepID=UPI00115E850B|nr:signal peptide peptidase SppA [Telmatospirillum sp. J64-1]